MKQNIKKNSKAGKRQNVVRSKTEGQKLAAADANVPKKKKSTVAEHKEALENLRETDPQFYEFLKEEDAEVFDFDVSDDDENEGAEVQDEEEEKEGSDQNDEFEQSSDLSFAEGRSETELSETKFRADDDDDDEYARKTTVTPELTEQWHRQLFEILESPGQCDLRMVGGLLNRVVDAFRAVVSQTGAEADAPSQRYRIDDAAGFNAVIRLCFSVYPTVWQSMGGSDIASMGQKKRKSLRPSIKPYLHNLAVFLQGAQNAQVLEAVLKHLSHVADYYSLFGSLSRTLLKILVRIWSTKEEDCRLLAFISIMKLLRKTPDPLVSIALKKMYLAYVQNTKVVTPTTLRQINFMQRSYAETCNIDKQLTYQFAFVYIRQLSIHLRNAITTKKKEQIGAVHNWQFIQCLNLWSRVLAHHAKNDVLQPLIYPLIQIVLGCIKLIPTAKYIPLRFHCVRSMIVLVQATDVYVPLLPIVLEAFQLIDVKKKHQRQSLKPFDFDCMLKLSQSQLQESALKPAVIEGALELMVEIMHVHAGSVVFPELAFICCSRLKSFYKSCHILSLARPAKEIADKISEHAAWMERRRTEAGLDLKVMNDVESFENQCSVDKESPMRKYYEIYKTIKERERKLKVQTETETHAQAEQPVDRNFSKRKQEMRKEKRKAKKPKVTRSEIIDEAGNQDEVRDLNLSDLDD